MDLTAIRNALAAQITAHTGLRCDGQARDSVVPPCAVVLPGQPFITYGVTMDGASNFGLAILLIISDAAPSEITQRALDAYLGIGTDSAGVISLADAVLADTSLGGTVDFCEPVSVTTYGRIDYSGVTYFGARINLTLGA